MKISNLKFSVLTILNQKPLSGYFMIKEIHKMTNWKPSTGSIYPLLINMGSMGLLKVKRQKRSKIYSLTEKGKTELTVFESKKQDYINDLIRQIDMSFSILSKKELEAVVEEIKKRIRRK